ncbi:cysteine desulfurase family protein [Microbacterium sp. ET2]|uniref:cysteine desulfurase family protein n=1 Tax=Microbacterium albipurpureum TaxID=3050384 RepID=UPI00259CC162|nr:cysteine desulfurase family protein [Microbacterium sp. ET2 (Ac-2212)]WJL95746.1 cysteine desulfurase family protein [Microbacterium sp. ET2 (Ac-2212)]
MTVYLDHAATSPLRPEAREAWLRAHEAVGNPSSIHGAGQAARRLLEDARERVAALLDADPIEIVFTSGGTEAVNLALKGLWWARPAGAEAVVLPDGEHHATLDAVDWLSRFAGAQVRAVPLDGIGRIDVTEFAVAAEGAAVATALAANNEVGAVNDVAALAAAASAAGVPFHVDAVAALGRVPVSFHAWRGAVTGSAGLVALSVAAHKVGGPVGVGALVVSRHARIEPLLHGGGQQRGLRAGTQDVAGSVAFAAALDAAEAEREHEQERVRELSDRLVRGIRATVTGAEVLGPPADGSTPRLAGNVHVLFPGAAGETLLFLLDRSGIAVSTGSACQAGVAEPSHVVLALGRSPVEARQVLRFSLGTTSTASDVDAVLRHLPEAVERARAASGLRSATPS